MELVFTAQFFTKLFVVVDFAVDSENIASVWAVERLLTGKRVDDGQSFMGDQCFRAFEDARPIGTTMADFLDICNSCFRKVADLPS